MDPHTTNASRIIARIASRAKGLVTRGELLAAGLSATQIKARLRNGALIREYPGVYRVGHNAPNAEAAYLAAVLACGKRSGLSGAPAARNWSLVRGKPPLPEVSAPSRRRVPDLITRHRRLHPSELTTHRGIPITSVPLTLLDISPY